MKKRLVMGFLMAFLLAAPAAFAAVGDNPTITHFALGWSGTLGDAADIANDGWNISGGVTLLPNPQRPFGVRFDLGYNWWDIKTSGLPNIVVDDGAASMWSLTSQAVWEFGGKGSVGGYLALGIGGYSRYARVSETVYYDGIYCWWGYCYPTVIGGSAVVADDRLTKFGYNGGLGITFELSSGSQFYLEVQYHAMISDPTTEYMPVLIGWRF